MEENKNLCTEIKTAIFAVLERVQNGKASSDDMRLFTLIVDQSSACSDAFRVPSEKNNWKNRP